MIPVLGFRRRLARERGSATVVILGLIGAVLMVTVSALVLASAVLASHRARAAGDLGALAAAGLLIQGDSPAAACQSAARVAAANQGRVQRCDVVGTEVRLTVAVTASVTGLGVATARSRAGPAPGEETGAAP